jgi:hypothetical protein
MSNASSRSTGRIESCDAVIRVYDEAGNVIEGMKINPSQQHLMQETAENRETKKTKINKKKLDTLLRFLVKRAFLSQN